MARKSGRLAQWDDERGFGFIAGDDGQRSFVHISQIKRSAIRPQPGDRVTYVPGTGRDGRPAANAVVVLGAPPPPSRAARPVGQGSPALGIGIRLAGAVLVVAGALAATQLARAPGWVLIAYLMLGVASIGVYWVDKAAAEAGRWRVREASLHALDLVGGIAGGLLAQALLRHKTRKPGFAVVTTLIAIAHLAALASLAAGAWDIPAQLR